MKKILITGSLGFIGKNLIAHLRDKSYGEILTFNRNQNEEVLINLIHQADVIVHLAGSNRPSEVSDFSKINVDLTKSICKAISSSMRTIPVIFTSSTQIEQSNPYGASKLLAEEILQDFSTANNNPIAVFRLPGVFGKWCKPNYNSVVATFCYNIANNLPIQIHDSKKELSLVYIDDVVNKLIQTINASWQGISRLSVNPLYLITIGELANLIEGFNQKRLAGKVDRVGDGLLRALYSSYLSYLPPEQFSYKVPESSDARGRFIEVLKTPDCGQFSFFTALPGMTRGDHYHHSKTEKFIVVQGEALFRFRNIITNETYEILTTSAKPQIVDSIPGWSHNIRNIGENDLIVMVWANEIFNRELPDTIPSKV